MRTEAFGIYSLDRARKSLYKKGYMMPKLAVCLIAMALLATIANAQLKPTQLTGTWRITEAKFTGPNARTVSSPQPGLLILTGNYYSRVLITSDQPRIDHSTCVNADTLFEAVARGLKVIRDSVWAGEIPEGINTVTVCAAPPDVQHRVKVSEFKAWLNRTGGSPTETVHRQKVKAIFG